MSHMPRETAARLGHETVAILRARRYVSPLLHPLEFLKPHGAQDMIDVQSFIWAITGDDGPAAG